MQWLIQSDDHIEIFEFVLQKIVRRHLASQSGETRPASVKFHTVTPLVRDCSVVLSALANVGSRNSGDSEKAFRAGELLLGSKTDGLQGIGGNGAEKGQEHEIKHPYCRVPCATRRKREIEEVADAGEAVL